MSPFSESHGGYDPSREKTVSSRVPGSVSKQKPVVEFGGVDVFATTLPPARERVGVTIGGIHKKLQGAGDVFDALFKKQQLEFREGGDEDGGTSEEVKRRYVSLSEVIPAYHALQAVASKAEALQHDREISDWEKLVGVEEFEEVVREFYHQVEKALSLNEEKHRLQEQTERFQTYTEHEPATDIHDALVRRAKMDVPERHMPEFYEATEEELQAEFAKQLGAFQLYAKCSSEAKAVIAEILVNERQHIIQDSPFLDALAVKFQAMVKRLESKNINELQKIKKMRPFLRWLKPWVS